MFKGILFIIGAVLGSFFNVCIYRLPKDISIVFPGSFCPKCNVSIKWYDNIPILSFFVLKGRCRHCKEGIPIRYLLVEVLTACLYFYLGNLYGLKLELLIWLFFFSLLILIAFIDLETFFVLDKVVYPGIAVGILLYIFLWRDLEHILGLVFGGGLIFLVAKLSSLILKMEGMGSGDVWIVGLIGLFLGFRLLISSLLISSIFAIIIGGSLILMGRKKRRDYISYGPYLAFGALVSFVFKERISCLFL
ncbi:MAG: prepilin peptidase [bacterium]